MLLIRPHPQITDTLPSYLLRLTAANGYKNPMLLLRSDSCKLLNNRLPGKKIFFGDFDLNRIAVLANINIAQVEALAFKQINSTRCLAFEQSFQAKNINFSHVRICPACYQEHSIIPFMNSLSAKTYCIKHCCSLVTISPVSGYKLTWGTHYLWRDAASWKDENSIIDVCEAEFNINQQLESLENTTLIIDQHSLNLAEYCDLLAFFAHFHKFAFTKNNSMEARSDLDVSRQYYSSAYWYIKEWPTQFFELLKHFENHPMSDTRITGIRKCFRDLYDDIYSPENSRSKAYMLLKSRFEEYLRDHFSNGVLTQSLTQVDPQMKNKSTFISESQVAEVLCCHLGKVKVYVREKLLSASHLLPNGTRLFLRLDVMELKSRLKNCCSIDECAELLGLSVYHARQLLRVCIITPLLEPNLTNRDWLIESIQITKLIEKLKAGSHDTVVNAKITNKRLAFAGYSLAIVIQQMLSGEIKYSYDENSDALYSLGQFTPIFQLNDATLHQLLTPKEACSSLGINKNAIYDFIKLGFIDCIEQKVNRTPRPIKLIPIESIKKFKSRYLLRHQLNGSPTSALETISGPKVNGGLINVYQRRL